MLRHDGERPKVRIVFAGLLGAHLDAEIHADVPAPVLAVQHGGGFGAKHIQREKRPAGLWVGEIFLSEHAVRRCLFQAVEFAVGDKRGFVARCMHAIPVVAAWRPVTVYLVRRGPVDILVVEVIFAEWLRDEDRAAACVGEHRPKVLVPHLRVAIRPLVAHDEVHALALEPLRVSVGQELKLEAGHERYLRWGPLRPSGVVVVDERVREFRHDFLIAVAIRLPVRRCDVPHEAVRRIVGPERVRVGLRGVVDFDGRADFVLAEPTPHHPDAEAGVGLE